MNRPTACLAGAVVLAACAVSQAIPPPWELEKAKAEADLILLAKTAKAAVVHEADAPGRIRQMQIGLEPVEVLKGKLPGDDGEKPPIVLLYNQPAPMPGPMQPRAVGGTGDPKVADGETALLFLKRQAGSETSFTVVCGSFGYVGLDVKAKEDLDRLTRRIDLYRGFCERIKEEAVRAAMKGYYDKALALAATALPPETPWQVVVGESADYKKAEAAETVLRGKMAVKNVGKPGVMYLRPPLEYYVKTATQQVLLGPPMDGLFGGLADKTIEVKGKMQPLQAGSSRTFFWVGWIRELTPPKPPDKPGPAPDTRPAPPAAVEP